MQRWHLRIGTILETAHRILCLFTLKKILFFKSLDWTIEVVRVLDAGILEDVPTQLAAGWAYLTLHSARLCSTQGSIHYPVFPLFLPPPSSFKSCFPWECWVLVKSHIINAGEVIVVVTSFNMIVQIKGVNPLPNPGPDKHKSYADEFFLSSPHCKWMLSLNVFFNLAPFYLKKISVCMVLLRNITFWTCAMHVCRSLCCDHMSGQKKGSVKQHGFRPLHTGRPSLAKTLSGLFRVKIWLKLIWGQPSTKQS